MMKIVLTAPDERAKAWLSSPETRRIIEEYRMQVREVIEEITDKELAAFQELLASLDGNNSALTK